MAVVKRVLCPQRLRRVPQQFSWIDHRLVRDRHICGRSAEALALYLLLVTVANVRIHGTTKRKPVDLFQTEKHCLKPLPTSRTTSASSAPPAPPASSA
jgi:hypothetical protein